jgi:hypothetical protein
MRSILTFIRHKSATTVEYGVLTGGVVIIALAWVILWQRLQAF